MNYLLSKLKGALILIFIFLVCLLPALSESYIKITGVGGVQAPLLIKGDPSMPDIVLDPSVAGDVKVDVESQGIPDGTKVKVKIKGEESLIPPEGAIQLGMTVVPVNLKAGKPKVLYLQTDPFLPTISPLSFAPKDITGLRLWLKADSESYNDGAIATTWTDRSGNGNNFIATNTPLWTANVINGKAVIRFSGGTDYYTSSFNLDDSVKTTIFLVAKGGGSTWETFLASGLAGDPTLVCAFNGPTAIRTWTNTSANYNDETLTASNNSAFHYYTITINETTGANGITSYRQDGIDETSTGSRNRGNGGSLVIGRDGQHFNGDYAELLIYEGNLTNEQITQIENYLKTKYGV